MNLLNKEEVLNLPTLKDGVDYKSLYIYFLLRNSEIIYIGISSNILSRIAQHGNKNFDNIKLLEIFEKNLQLESDYILKFKPRYNKIFKSDKVINISYIKDVTPLNNTEITTHIVCGKWYIYLSDLNKLDLDLVPICEKKGTFKVVRRLSQEIIDDILSSLLMVEIGEIYVFNKPTVKERMFNDFKLNLSNNVSITISLSTHSRIGFEIKVLSFETVNGDIYFIKDYIDEYCENKNFIDIVDYFKDLNKNYIDMFLSLSKKFKLINKSNLL